jgi:CHAT domain-containing protein
MKPTTLDVQAIVYSVDHESISGLWFSRSGRSQVCLGSTKELLPEIDALREELTRTLDVAIGRVPALHEFMAGWGRQLLPPAILADPPDVLVLIPHALLHDLPLHLVLTDSARHLGTACGISYCSGLTLFSSCTRRNPSRHADLESGRFGEGDATEQVQRRRLVCIGGVDVAAGGYDAFAQLAHALATRFADGDSVTVKEWPGSDVCRGTVLNQFRPHTPAESRPDILCLVAHGDIDLERHQLSGLLLGTLRGMAGSKTSFGTTIKGNRYYRMDLPLRTAPAVQTARSAEVLAAAELETFGYSGTELVCLLGCSAGSGRVLQADEPASLAETFLKLGSAAVIAPMWDAHIEPTSVWITHFFEALLREGKPKALAARDATAEAVRSYGPQLAGVMTLRGDWL